MIMCSNKVKYDGVQQPRPKWCPKLMPKITNIIITKFVNCISLRSSVCCT